MTDFRAKLKQGAADGLKRGWGSFLWMAKIVVPMSLVITVLQWSGWLQGLDGVMSPLTGLINLPPEAALPIISALLVNLYAVIAAFTVIPFTASQMTLIAVFTLIAHNLVMEGIVQHKSGINAAKVIIVRIVMASVTVFVISLFMTGTELSVGGAPGTAAVQPPFLDVLGDWAVDTLLLVAKMCGIIMGIMLTLGCLRSLGWTDYLIRFFSPLMKAIGLPRRTAMMFVAAILFGVFYGGAVIMEEAKKGDLSKEDLERLHVFIGINHAMLEDPALFTVFGLNYLMMVIPRFVAAVVAVQLYRLYTLGRKRLFPAGTAS